MSAERRAAYWRRYWRVLERFRVTPRSATDLFLDRVLAGRPGRWLDAGCGRQTFPRWRLPDREKLAARGVHLMGCDLDLAALRDRADGTPLCGADLARLPYTSGAFEGVLSNMAFEHLTSPEPAVEELVRVTRPGGRILVHTVNARHYLALAARLTPFRFHRWIVARVEGRAVEDVYPTQYRANTEARLTGLFEARGCRLVWGGAVADLPLHVPVPVLFWLALGWGLLEVQLARLPGRGPWLKPNLLMEFERS